MTNAKVLKGLLKVARMYGVRVKSDKSLVNDGLYEPPRCVVVPRLTGRSLTLTTLAHELGHHFDYLGRGDEMIAAAYVWGPDHYKAEQIAWDNARTLLKMCGFRYWEVYRKDCKESLESHKRWCE